MKDNLKDLIDHVNALGIETIKVVGTANETKVSALAEDRSVIISGTFKNVNADFIGTFGLPNLSKLKTILSFEEYDDKAVVQMVQQTTPDGTVPANIHFASADGKFENDYRLMSQGIVEEKVKAVKFAGATWNLDCEPKVAYIQKLKRQASANSENPYFTTKVVNGELVITFGNPSTHSGNFVFDPAPNGSSTKSWAWPAKQFLAIMDLQGDKKLFISDQGAMKITVDSGITEFEYLLPAHTT